MAKDRRASTSRASWDRASITGVLAPVTDEQEAARHGVNASARVLAVRSFDVVGPDGETIDGTTPGIEDVLTLGSNPLADEVTLEMTLGRFARKHVEMHR